MSSKQLIEFAKSIKETINCCLPARIVKINDDGTVNVVAIRNDEIEDCVITVPVLEPESANAYIKLALHVGDRGVVTFCDKSIENYRLTGAEGYNKDDRNHSISDGVFHLGFLPNNEKFVFPDGEIVIGLKSGACTVVIDANGQLTINSSSVTINSDVTIAKKLTVNSDVTVNGKVSATGDIKSDSDVIAGTISGKLHVHTGNMGADTSTPH